MAAPAFQAVGTIGETTTNTVSFTYPAVAANDLLFLMVWDNGQASSLTKDASWTLVRFQKVDNIWLFRKLATGSETGTENLTRVSPVTSGQKFAAQCYSFRGNDFITVESSVKRTGTGDTITWDATTVSGTERTLAAFIVNRYGGDPGTPSGYTMNADDTLGDSTQFELSTKANVSSGTSVTATGGSTNFWITFHVSIYNNTPAVLPTRSFIIN